MALLNLTRTVARRAERRVVTLSRSETIIEQMLPYIDRPSGLLFVMARIANHGENKQDIEWHAKQ